ncbi:MAG: oxidoreductase [Conexibacter sp.]|nr:oxidoreductase [Conexibacter sp.]
MARAALLERLISAPQRLSWRIATVREVIEENPRARSLVLDVPAWAGHRAGQHLDVRLTAEDGYQAQRSFSIASPPEQPTVELTVDPIEDGEVSPYLTQAVRAGDELEVRGPIGGPFTWTVDDGGPLLLLGGGSGLVPLMAMLRHRAARESTIETRALISVRTATDALYRRELAELGPREGLEVRWTYTRTAPPGWDGWRGRVSAEMLELLGSPAAPQARPRVFVCGPTGFVEHVATLLVDAGHDPARVRTERFGPS